MKARSDSYTIAFNAWAITILGSPIVVLAYWLTFDLQQIDFSFSLLLSPFILIPLSIPVLLPSVFAYSFIFKKTQDWRFPLLASKLLACLTGAALICYIHFLLSGDSPGPSLLRFDFRILPISYSLVLIVSTLLLKGNKQPIGFSQQASS